MIIPEQRILLAVINAAIFDACLQPVRRLGVSSKKKDFDVDDFIMNKHARSAMNFLHGDGLETYCMWLEQDPGWLRDKLHHVMHSDEPQIRLSKKDQGFRIDDSKRRSYRLNDRIWRLSPFEEVDADADAD